MPFDNTPIENPLAAGLERAAQILGKGWCQGMLWNGKEHCMIGAIMAANSAVPTDHSWSDTVWEKASPQLVAVSEALGGTRWGVSSKIADWNNAPGRTQQECVDMLRKAKELV